MIATHWPAPAAILVLLITMAFPLLSSLAQNNGRLVYALDDPYIHMALAKHFVLDGVWGITSQAFSSSSSSLLWTLLLSLSYFVFGISEVAPLVLNALFATAIILVVSHVIRNAHASNFVNFLVLLAIIFFAPLPALAFTGMEHTLHMLLTIVFATQSANLAVALRPTRVQATLLLLLSVLLVLARYEGLFLVAVVSLIFLIQRRARLAVALPIAATAPMFIYGAISVAQGWYWLPNSLLLKGTMPDASTPLLLIRSLGGRALAQLRWSPPLLVLVLCSVALLVVLRWRTQAEGMRADRSTILQVTFVGTTLLHLQFASIGWFYRYEAYLIALGLLTIAVGATTYMRRTPALVPERRSIARTAAGLLVLVIAVAPFASRAGSSLQDAARAMNDRYLEHIYPAEFVSRYYNNSTIAMNDIGAVSFYSDAKILDLYGLGSLEPVKFRKQASGYSKEDVFNWTKQMSAKIAIVQLDWPEIRDRIPDEWTKVGEWRVPRNVVFVDDTRVGFYAVDPAEREGLAQKLASFSTTVPSSVVQSK